MHGSDKYTVFSTVVYGVHTPSILSSCWKSQYFDAGTASSFSVNIAGRCYLFVAFYTATDATELYAIERGQQRRDICGVKNNIFISEMLIIMDIISKLLCCLSWLDFSLIASQLANLWDRSERKSNKRPQRQRNRFVPFAFLHHHFFRSCCFFVVNIINLVHEWTVTCAPFFIIIFGFFLIFRCSH